MNLNPFTKDPPKPVILVYRPHDRTAIASPSIAYDADGRVIAWGIHADAYDMRRDMGVQTSVYGNGFSHLAKKEVIEAYKVRYPEGYTVLEHVGHWTKHEEMRRWFLAPEPAGSVDTTEAS